MIAAVSPSLTASRQGAGDHEAARPARRRAARLRPGRRGRARATSRRCGRRRASCCGSARGGGAPWLGRAACRARPARLALVLASASTARAQVYTRRNANGVVEATNVPDSPGFHLTYPGKGTLIHSRGFQRTRAYWSMYDHHVEEAARAAPGEPRPREGVIAVESEFDQWAVSSKGARGLMQLMPATARRLGVADSFDARQNIFARHAVPADPARPVRGRRRPSPSPPTTPAGARPALRRHPALPGDARLRAEGAGPARRGFAAPAPAAGRGRLLRPLDALRAPAPAAAGPRRAPAASSRPGPAPTTAGATSAA